MGSLNLINWKQLVDGRSPEAIQFGMDETRAVLIGDTDFSNIINGTVVKAILGFPARSSVPSSRILLRNLPVQHPFLPYLWAKTIVKVEGIKPTGKVTPAPLDAYANYSRCRLTVLFESRPYDILDDNAVAQLVLPEFNRFVEKTYTYAVENITRPGNQYIWVQDNVGNTQNPLGGQPFNSGIIKRVPKAELTWIWHDVPGTALLDSNGIAPNIHFRLSTVNNDWFPIPNSKTGYPPYTLLLKNYKVVPKMAPVSPVAMGLPLTSPPRLYNVIFTVIYFDPPYDPSFRPDIIPAFRGHLLFPPPSTISGTDQNGQQSSLWYPATRDAAVAGPTPPYRGTLYDATDWTPLFTPI